jgi:hypothetical protein
MEFNLEVQMKIGGTGVLSGGRFRAHNQKEIPKVAHQYIRQIKYDTGYRDTVIEKVTVDGTEDITSAVIEIDTQAIPDLDDIFW